MDKDTKDSFSDMGKKVEDAAAAVGKAAHDLADCVPAVERASKAFEGLRKAAEPLRAVPAIQQELLNAALGLVERAAWHLKSAEGCLIAGAVKKPERFLQAYRQFIQTNTEVGAIADKLERRFPETARTAASIRESVTKSIGLAEQILTREMDLPFVRSAKDGPGPKKPLS